MSEYTKTTYKFRLPHDLDLKLLEKWLIKNIGKRCRDYPSYSVRNNSSGGYRARYGHGWTLWYLHNRRKHHHNSSKPTTMSLADIVIGFNSAVSEDKIVYFRLAWL